MGYCSECGTEIADYYDQCSMSCHYKMDLREKMKYLNKIKKKEDPLVVQFKIEESNVLNSMDSSHLSLVISSIDKKEFNLAAEVISHAVMEIQERIDRDEQN